jgi:pimeloyl-ACP methyl ester carboxylesterase
MRRLTAPLFAFILAGCAEQPVTAPIETVSSTRTVIGETGPGSQYAFQVPANWNGDVIYYAHGIRPASDPVELPTGDGFPALRDALGQLGYAVAYSSFSENGWAVKDGVQRTHQLRGLFAAKFGQPRRSYLVGTSLGGLVAQKLADEFPGQYDGTLAMCAPLAGATAELNYVGNVRVLFDLFYPGVVPGDVLNVPAGLNLATDVLGPAQAAVIANPSGLGAIARMAQTPLAGNNGTELVTSLLYALTYNVIGTPDFLDRTHGHSPFDNSQTVYTGLLDPSVLGFVNATVGRFAATPDASNYLDRNYDPSGDLTLPTLTLHTTRDPLVPFFHEQTFAANAAARGSAASLVQRSIDRYGHCTFTTAEMVDAFQSLTAWAERGVRPTT